MAKRRLRLVALAGLTVVAAGVAVVWPRPPSRITRENFDRIPTGMSRAEVEAILGPPGDYRTGPTTAHEIEYCPPSPFPPSARPVRTVVSDWRPTVDPITGKTLNLGPFWDSDAGSAEVHFDEAGRVDGARYFGCKRVEQTLPENLVWRAKRQWHRWFP
jgi:hypothetical protein